MAKKKRRKATRLKSKPKTKNTMARRKRRTTRHRRPSVAHRKSATRRRRRSHGMGAGLFSNPLIGVATGAAAAGLIGGFLAKPGASGKPFIESPVMRAAIVGGVVFFAGKMLKSPAIGLGGVAVSAYSVIKNSGFVGANFGLNDGAQIDYVSPSLLAESSTLADGTTLADGNQYYVARGGQWTGPYAATGY